MQEGVTARHDQSYASAVSLPPPGDAVRHVQWFDGLSHPRVYLLGVVGMPLAIVLIATQPLPAPELIYGALVGASGLPVWAMVRSGAAARQHSPYNLWSLRAQLWLQLGGAVAQAVGGDRAARPNARHARPVD